MKQCKYVRDWAGRCKNDAEEWSDFCSEHRKIKCKVCGKQATHNCSEASYMVCGTPLCDGCRCPRH